MFENEPAKASPLFGTPNFISTPHLGASTSEAQVNVAIQVAEQMSDFLLLGGVTNAINMPSLTAEEAPRLKPYMALAEKLGQAGRPDRRRGRRSISVEVEGAAAQLNQKPITGAVLAGLMGTYSQTVNMVNAPFLAKERGLDVRESATTARAIITRWSRSPSAPRAATAGSRAPCSATRRRGWSRSSGSRSRPSSTAA